MEDEFPNLSQDDKKIANEALDAFEDVKSTIKNVFNRNLGSTQRNIIINQSMDIATEKWNTLLSSQFSDEGYFVETLFKISQTIRACMNKIPNSKEYDPLIISLQSTYNFCLIIISFQKGEQGQFRLQGAANILVSILTGLPEIQEITLPEKGKHDYQRSFEGLVSYLFSTEVMLTSVMRSLPNIDNNNLIEWMNYVIRYQKKLETVTDSIDLRYFHNEVYDRGESQFYFNIEILHQWFFHKIRFIYVVQKMKGEKWIELTEEDFDMLEGNDPFIWGIEDVNMSRKQLLDDIDELFHQGVLSPNYPPENAKELQYSRNYIKLDTYRKNRYQYFKKHYLSIDQLKSQGNDVIQKLLVEVNAAIQILEEANEDPEIIFKPEDLEYYIDTIYDLVLTMGIEAIVTGTVKSLSNRIDNQLQELKHIEIENRPKIQLFERLVILFVYSNTEFQFDEKYYLQQLSEVQEQIQHDSRDYISIVLLEIIVKLQFELISNRELEQKLSQLKITLESSGNEHLLDDFLTYQNYLLKFAKNEEAELPLVQNKNYLDPKSWVIPKFEHEKDDYLIYLPFNKFAQKVQ